MVRNSWRGAEYLISKKPRLVRVKKACENKDFCGVSSGEWEQLKKNLTLQSITSITRKKLIIGAINSINSIVLRLKESY